MVILAVATGLAWAVSGWSALGLLRRGSLLARLRRLLAAMVFACLGFALASALAVVQVFQAFAGETLIARVTTRPIAREAFELTYQPVAIPPVSRRLRWPVSDETLTVQLRGDQWVVSGGVVKWQPWLTALGLSSYHRPMRLTGQFSDLTTQQAAPPSVAPIGPPVDWLWELLYRAQRFLPFIESAYGSAAYSYVEPEMVQEIYVTPSGYLIKRKAAP